MRLAVLALLASACAFPFHEEHGGASPRPAPPDAAFIAAGAAGDALLQVIHVRPVVRVATVPLLGLVLRSWKPLGRSEGSGFLFVWGAGLSEIVGMILRGRP